MLRGKLLRGIEGIKVANQFALKWGDYPGLAQWAHFNQEGP